MLLNELTGGIREKFLWTISTIAPYYGGGTLQKERLEGKGFYRMNCRKT